MAYDKVVDSAKLDADLTYLADIIRAQTGGTEKFNTIVQMANALENMDAFEAGKRAEYDAFWDAFQQNGSITNCYSLFAGQGWTGDTFKPKYVLHPINAERMFYATGVKNLTLSGIVDFSAITGMNNFLTDSTIVESVDVLDCSNPTTAVTNPCYYNKNLKSIGQIVMRNDGSTQFSINSFNHNYRLETVGEIVGEIGVSLSLNENKQMTHDTLMVFINALQTKTSGTFTLTLGATNLAKLTDAEKAIATGKGWTLA